MGKARRFHFFSSQIRVEMDLSLTTYSVLMAASLSIGYSAGTMRARQKPTKVGLIDHGGGLHDYGGMEASESDDDATKIAEDCKLVSLSRIAAIVGLLNFNEGTRGSDGSGNVYWENCCTVSIVSFVPRECFLSPSELKILVRCS